MWLGSFVNRSVILLLNIDEPNHRRFENGLGEGGRCVVTGSSASDICEIDWITHSQQRRITLENVITLDSGFPPWEALLALSKFKIPRHGMFPVESSIGPLVNY